MLAGRAVVMLRLLLQSLVGRHLQEAIPPPQGCRDGLHRGCVAGRSTGKKQGDFEGWGGMRGLGKAQCWRKKRAGDD